MLLEVLVEVNCVCDDKGKYDNACDGRYDGGGEYDDKGYGGHPE